MTFLVSFLVFISYSSILMPFEPTWVLDCQAIHFQVKLVLVKPLLPFHMLWVFHIYFQSPNNTHVTKMYLSPCAYKCSCWEVIPSLYLTTALPHIQHSPPWLPSLPALGKHSRPECLLISCEPEQIWWLWFLQNFSPDLFCWSLWIQHIWNKMQLSFWLNINVANYFKWN